MGGRVGGVITTLLFAVGATLLVAGAVMIVFGRDGRHQVRRELANQEIVFPAAGDLPDGLVGHAGERVVSGELAKAYAELIGVHVAKATAGRTYAQIAGEWQASGRADERLAKLRETAFMGQTLRGSLLGAYQAWQITTLTIGLGALLGAIGVVFVALAVTGL
jgi:hypothetical protein